MKRLILPLLALVGLVALDSHIKARAGSTDMREFTLIRGGDTDTTEQASIWIPIRGASKVMIRTWSTHLAFATNNADTTYSDSLQAFNVLLSDSVAFMARDSAGTMVTARSTIPTVPGTHGEPYPVCGDSLILPITAAGDTNIKGVAAFIWPINKELRAPATGSGIWTTVQPTYRSSGVPWDTRSVISTSYLRIRCTPLRRMTVTGFSSTAGKRVVGLRGLRMKAYVYYPDGG